MSVKAFFDSNIFIYTFDDIALEKQQIAQGLVKKALRDGSGNISYQVVQEVLNVLTRKLPLSMNVEDATRYLANTLEPLWRVQPGAEFFLSGLSLQARYKFGFYDSLIIAAALAAGCTRLYSEDLQHGQRIEGLTIEDPFREA
ncbi:MAG: PIN domain-containing protein [Gammaproteobacteria bacterium]